MELLALNLHYCTEDHAVPVQYGKGAGPGGGKIEDNEFECEYLEF